MDDDIIRMALEAQQERLSLDGRSPSTALSGYWFSMEVADLARFAALVRADERKRIKAEPVAGVVLNEEGRAALVEHGREEWHCAARNARRLYTVPPQQAEPVEPVALKHRHEWFRTGGMEPGQFRCIHCGVWGQEQSDHQIEDRLARHGIPTPGDPK